MSFSKKRHAIAFQGYKKEEKTFYVHLNVQLNFTPVKIMKFLKLEFIRKASVLIFNALGFAK